MGTMHFGMASVIGLRRLPIPAASRKAFTPPPSVPPPERASARWPRRACLRDRPIPQATRRRPQRNRPVYAEVPSLAAQGADVREDVAGVAEAVLAGHHARCAEPY